MLCKADSIKREVRQHMRGGEGSIILDSFDAPNPENCRLISVITVNPGCSIGTHSHSGETELYYILEGELVGTDESGDFVMEKGDALFTGGGASHSVRNDTDAPCKMLAVIVTE